MISNQVLQNTLEGLKEISRTEFCVLDTEGKVLASTFADFSIATQDVQAFVESQADSQLVKGFQYFKVCDCVLRWSHEPVSAEAQSYKLLLRGLFREPELPCSYNICG